MLAQFNKPLPLGPWPFFQLKYSMLAEWKPLSTRAKLLKEENRIEKIRGKWILVLHATSYKIQDKS